MESGTKRMNYRELQAVAKKMRLPGNLKHQLLLQLIEARKNGNEFLVNQILAEQKVERAKRKSEKLEAKEAAYKHLQMPQDKRLGGRLKKFPATPKFQESNVPQNSDSGPDSQIRSLLKMSPHSIHQLLKQQSKPANNNHVPQNPPRDHYLDRNSYNQNDILQFPMTSQPYVEDFSSQQKARPPPMSCPSRSFDPFGGGLYDYRNNDTRKSFQMRDILSNEDPNNYPVMNPGISMTMPQTSTFYDLGTSYLNDLIPPLNQQDNVSCSFPYYPSTSYPAAPQDYWGMYATKPLYTESCMRKCEPYTNLCNNTVYPDSNLLGTPNSDTLSAPDQDFDLIFPCDQELSEIKPDTSNQPYPVYCSYLSSGEPQMFNPMTANLSEVENYITPDNPSPSGDLILSQSLTPLTNSTSSALDQTRTDVSSNVCFLNVVDHQEWRTFEYTVPVQPFSNYYHSVSSHHSYIQLK